MSGFCLVLVCTQLLLSARSSWTGWGGVAPAQRVPVQMCGFSLKMSEAARSASGVNTPQGLG